MPIAYFLHSYPVTLSQDQGHNNSQDSPSFPNGGGSSKEYREGQGRLLADVIKASHERHEYQAGKGIPGKGNQKVQTS